MIYGTVKPWSNVSGLTDVASQISFIQAHSLLLPIHRSLESGCRPVFAVGERWSILLFLNVGSGPSVSWGIRVVEQ